MTPPAPNPVDVIVVRDPDGPQYDLRFVVPDRYSITDAAAVITDAITTVKTHIAEFTYTDLVDELGRRGFPVIELVEHPAATTW